jgi:predicted transposase/invertase (TIGR01784 family)
VLEVMNFNEDERDVYEGRVKFLRQEASAVKKSFDDGKIEGKIEIAREMIKENFSDDVIMKLSKLSRDELETLRKSL